jgi:hypothetical protein
VVTGDEQQLGCALCEVLSGRGDPQSLGRGTLVAYCDDELIALLKPGRPGVLVAPHQHVGSLSALPENAADFLAALRQTVTEVQHTYGTSGAMIEPSTDLAWAPGHICFCVVPTRREASQPREIDMKAQARRLTAMLQDRRTARGLRSTTTTMQ